MKDLKTTLALFALLVIVSCGEEEIPPEDGVVEIRVNHIIDDESFALNTEYDFNGQTVEFTDFRYFISNIKFKAQNGSELDGPSKKAWLISPEDNVLNLGKNSDRSLFQTSFLVGLDAETNHEDPTMASEEDLMNNEMHWGWNPGLGYKFIRIEGTVDGEEFGYHIATDELLAEIIDLEVALINEQDATNVINLVFDVDELFQNIILIEGQQHGNNQFNGTVVNNLESNAVFKVQ